MNEPLDEPMDSMACQNATCPFGIGGKPRVFVPGRFWSKYCCRKCRMQVGGRTRTAARAARAAAAPMPEASLGLPDSAITMDPP